MSKKELVALFVENASLYHKDLGRLEHGYNILDKKDADIWVKNFPKI